MNKTGFVYVATDTARNNRRYVGQTTKTLKIRKRGEYNRYFQNAINDHGDQIEWKIAEEIPIEQLDFMERLYIWGLNTVHPNGYNFESGGHENKTLSEETKRKLSIANAGENQARSKLIWKDVEKIRYEYNFNNQSVIYLAQKYQVSESNIYLIVENKIWKNKNYKQTRGLQTKLTWKNVNEIRHEYNFNSQSIKDLAQKYKTSKNNIKHIISNKTWKDENYKQIRCPTPKLTQKDATEIRYEYNFNNQSISYLVQKYKTTENNIGRIIKNKNYKQTKGSQAKLTWEDATEIRHEYNFNNQSIKDLAKKYKTVVSNIRHIINNENWKNKSYKRTRYQIGYSTSKLTWENVEQIRHEYNFNN